MKKKKLKKIYPLIALFKWVVILISSCNNGNQAKQPSYFPNQLGDSWTYNVRGNPANLIQVKVVITGNEKLPDGENAMIWQYNYDYPSLTLTDSLWVTETNSNVWIYDKPGFEQMHYVLPLSVGNSWNTTAVSGTTKVLAQLNVSVPSGNFNNVYELSKKRGYVVNSWTNDTIYFKDHVGIVKLIQREFNLGPVIGNGTWELVSYHIQ